MVIVDESALLKLTSVFETISYFKYTNTMRKCTKCKQLKSLTEFNYKYKSRGIRQVQCRTCTQKQLQVHYHNHRNYYLVKAKKRHTVERNKIRNYIWSYLRGHSCVDCGENDPIVLEFDHLSDKIDGISNLIKSDSLKKVQEEMVKCEVRCANCHRRATALRRGWTKEVFAPIAQRIEQ